MAKPKKQRLTKNQALWEKELSLLKRRAKEWEKKFHAKFTNIPVTPERITKKDIERVKAIRWKNLAEKEKEIAREEYSYRYDEGEILPDVPLSPLDTDEDGYLDGRTRETIEPSEGEEPVDTKEQLEQLLEELRQAIEDGGDKYGDDNPDAKNRLNTLIDNAVQRGNEGLLNYLQEPGVMSRLNKAALEALKYHEEWKGGGGTTYQSNLQEFVSILNMDRPISPEDSAYINETGTFNFDYSDYET